MSYPNGEKGYGVEVKFIEDVLNFIENASHSYSDLTEKKSKSLKEHSFGYAHDQMATFISREMATLGISAYQLSINLDKNKSKVIMDFKSSINDKTKMLKGLDEEKAVYVLEDEINNVLRPLSNFMWEITVSDFKNFGYNKYDADIKLVLSLM